MNPRNDTLLVFQLWRLASYQPEHNSLIRSKEFQWLKSSRPLIIELQEVTINLNIGKESLGDSLIGALSKPHGTIISSTRVHGNSHLLPLRNIN